MKTLSAPVEKLITRIAPDTNKTALELVIARSTVTAPSRRISAKWGVPGMLDDPSPHETFACPIDILAVVVALSHRPRAYTGNSASPSISEYLDTSVLSTITKEDIVEAEAIRSYFGQKLVMGVLTEETETKYRRDLKAFLVSDGKTFTQAQIGLICTLPEFYQYDMLFESIKPQFTSDPQESPRTLSQRTIANHGRTRISLVTLVRKMERKRGKKIDYWLRECSTGYPFLLPLDALNPLEHLLDREFANGKTAEISFTPMYTERDKFAFHTMKNYRIL